MDNKKSETNSKKNPNIVDFTLKDLLHDPKKLNDISEASEMIFVSQELMDPKAPKDNIEFSKVKSAWMAGGDTEVVFPQLWSNETELSLDSDSLKNDLEFLLDVQAGDLEHPLIYSLRVVAPAPVSLNCPQLHSLNLTPGQIQELSSGYLYQEMIGKLPAEVRAGYLSELIAKGNQLEVSLVLPDNGTVRKTVSILKAVSV